MRACAISAVVRRRVKDCSCSAVGCKRGCPKGTPGCSFSRRRPVSFLWCAAALSACWAGWSHCRTAPFAPFAFPRHTEALLPLRHTAHLPVRAAVRRPGGHPGWNLWGRPLCVPRHWCVFVLPCCSRHCTGNCRAPGVPRTRGASEAGGPAHEDSGRDWSHSHCPSSGRPRRILPHQTIRQNLQNTGVTVSHLAHKCKERPIWAECWLLVFLTGVFVARFRRWHRGGHELYLGGSRGRLFRHHFLGEINDLAYRNAPRRLLVAGKLQRVHDPPCFTPHFLHLLL